MIVVQLVLRAVFRRVREGGVRTLTCGVEDRCTIGSCGVGCGWVGGGCVKESFAVGTVSYFGEGEQVHFVCVELGVDALDDMSLQPVRVRLIHPRHHIQRHLQIVSVTLRHLKYHFYTTTK